MTTIFAKHVDLPFRLVSGVRYPQISGMGNTICSEQKEKYFIKYTDILSSGKNYKRLSDMQNRQDAIQDRCRSRRIQDKSDAAQDGCSIVLISVVNLQYSRMIYSRSGSAFFKSSRSRKKFWIDPIILNMFLSVCIGLPKLLSVCGLPKLLSCLTTSICAVWEQ